MAGPTLTCCGYAFFMLLKRTRYLSRFSHLIPFVTSKRADSPKAGENHNGMSLLMVQQWMAHASPEMTLIYAKILDETMRTQWEKVVQHGIVQFNEGKPEYVPGKKMLTVLHEPQAFDPERVRNYRANTKLPVGNCVKSPKLICK